MPTDHPSETLAPRLYDDIVFEICRFINSDLTPKGNPALFTPEQVLKTLRCLSTVSRSWSRASRSMEYRIVRLPTAARLAKFLEIVDLDNTIADHVATIVVGNSLDGCIDLAMWNSQVIDIRILGVFLPNLQALTIGNLSPPHSNSTDTILRRFRSMDIPAYSGISSLAVHLGFFAGPSDARTFFRNIPSLSSLCLFDVSPVFVLNDLPHVLPSGIKTLRLEEYTLWDLIFQDVVLEACDPPPQLAVSLDRFTYGGLSIRAAILLEFMLVELARGAVVQITFADVSSRHKSLEAEFRLLVVDLNRRLIKASRQLLILLPQKTVGQTPSN